MVNGSIPPNKSDLLNFGVLYLESNANGKFLNVFWHRVQEPSGTTNMDFEFNKSSTISGNGVTPVRCGGVIVPSPVRPFSGRDEPETVPVAVGDLRAQQPVRGRQLYAVLERSG